MFQVLQKYKTNFKKIQILIENSIISIKFFNQESFNEILGIQVGSINQLLFSDVFIKFSLGSQHVYLVKRTLSYYKSQYVSARLLRDIYLSNTYKCGGVCWNTNNSTTSNALDILWTPSAHQARRLFVSISFINHFCCDEKQTRPNSPKIRRFKITGRKTRPNLPKT